ncbi:hypothetical protein [Streptomyces sp. NPDC059398]|uniref:hypothetical protein n=1 Tax=Streptomyces sp. NPDC059398 TaxID=3346820 RepID=UPI003686EC15
MNIAETTRVPHEDPVFIVGISGRLPLRTMSVLELPDAELQRYRNRWNDLLADRRLLPKQGSISHPRRIVKGCFGVYPRDVNPKAAQALRR